MVNNKLKRPETKASINAQIFILTNKLACPGVNKFTIEGKIKQLEKKLSEKSWSEYLAK